MGLRAVRYHDQRCADLPAVPADSWPAGDGHGVLCGPG